MSVDDWSDQLRQPVSCGQTCSVVFPSGVGTNLKEGAMRKSLRRALATALAVVLWNGSLLAQSTTGRISGIVSDSSGAVLPGVVVTVTEQATGLTRSASSDQSGAYLIVNLPVGSYTVSTELAGFKKAVKSGYALVADGKITANF